VFRSILDYKKLVFDGVVGSHEILEAGDCKNMDHNFDVFTTSLIVKVEL
jgi:hypothetical protein